MVAKRGRPMQVHPQRSCLRCGKEYGRSRSPGGSLESWPRYAARKYCSLSCANPSRDEMPIMSQVTLDLIEDLEWIIDHDSPENVARRLGRDRAYLETRMHSLGRHDLALKLYVCEDWSSSAVG